jgi:hypothetical protein
MIFRTANRIGLVFGIVLGAWHLVWVLLVLFGVAQAIYDFILWAHMIRLPLTIGPFDLKAAVTLIAVSTCLGYIFGFVGALIWNRVHRIMNA